MSETTGSAEILLRLAETIRKRQTERPERSYVVQLLDADVTRVSTKLMEEAAEVIEAAGIVEDDPSESEALVYEAADLIFHLWVMLVRQGVAPERVFAELDRRFGTSGIAEKESRASKGDK